MNTPKFFYFDLGNVLVTFCNDRMVRQMAEVAGLAPEGVRALLLEENGRPTVQWRFECGEMTRDEYYEHFCTATGSAPDRAALELAASDIFAPIEDSMRLVQRLAAAGRRLGVLSNTNSVHWSFVTDGRYDALTAAFEAHVTSFDARSMKPDAGIYLHAAARAGVAPAEMFFVDDREENVAGARALGVDAVRYTSHDRLVDELLARGVTEARA